MNDIISVGKNLATGIAMHVNNAERGLKSNCCCYECGERLEAHQGEIKIWHFKHTNKSECKGNPDKGLHDLAISVLAGNNEIKIESNNIIRYTINSVEKKQGNFIPDLTIFDDGGTKWWFEVAVTHFIEGNKMEYINSSSQKCIEIDLSKISRNINVEELTKVIFSQHKLITIFPKTKSEIKSSEGLLLGAIITGVLFFLSRFLKRKRRAR